MGISVPQSDESFLTLKGVRISLTLFGLLMTSRNNHTREKKIMIISGLLHPLHPEISMQVLCTIPSLFPILL